MPCEIIIVDDDQDIGTMLTIVLSQRYKAIVHCKSREEFFEQLTRCTPRLVILDVFLAGVDGRDVCREIRSNDAIREVPVLMISATTNVKESCLAAGADNFISKPFVLSELTEEVHSLLRKS